MLSYILRRMVVAPFILLIVITITFFMAQAVPGGPFDSERALSSEVEANMKAYYGLDKPVFVQYTNYLGKLLHGDLGPSISNKNFTVAEILENGLKASLLLGLGALLVALLCGVPLGCFAALRRNTVIDYGSMTLAMIGIVLPVFAIAPIMQWVFADQLGWFYTSGWPKSSSESLWPYVVLPIVSLALPQVAYIARMTRASMLEVLHTNYIRTAHAKGLSSWLVITRHALKGALMPVVSYLGPASAALISGSLVVEKIFVIPGVGQQFVKGALNRDYFLVLGLVVFYSTLIIVMNLLVDILYSFLDPKIKSGN